MSLLRRLLLNSFQRHFRLFWIFRILFSDCLLLVCRNTVNFCSLTFHSVPLLCFLSSSSIFGILVYINKHVICQKNSSTYKKKSMCLIFILMKFCYCSPFLIPDLRLKALPFLIFLFLLLIVILAVCFSFYTIFYLNICTEIYAY